MAKELNIPFDNSTIPNRGSEQKGSQKMTRFTASMVCYRSIS